MHCQTHLRDPNTLHPGTDGHGSSSFERATGRCTSPSVHACPAPHRGKTSRRPARRVPTHSHTTLPVIACHPLTTATRPPSAAPPRRTMLVAVVSKLALTPATRARRVRTPRTAHTPTTHTVVGRSPIIVGPENQPFLARQPNARDPGNKAAASAHGMGSGGLAVDAMAVGSLGVERRVERLFALHSIFQSDPSGQDVPSSPQDCVMLCPQAIFSTPQAKNSAVVPPPWNDDEATPTYGDMGSIVPFVDLPPSLPPKSLGVRFAWSDRLHIEDSSVRGRSVAAVSFQKRAKA